MKNPQTLCATCSIVWSPSLWNQNFFISCFWFFWELLCSILHLWKLLCRRYALCFFKFFIHTHFWNFCTWAIFCLPQHLLLKLLNTGTRNKVKTWTQTCACCWLYPLTVITFPHTVWLRLGNSAPGMHGFTRWHRPGDILTMFKCFKRNMDFLW